MAYSTQVDLLEPIDMAEHLDKIQLYLGQVIVCTPDRVSFPDLTVEQAVRVFLTGGMGLPGVVHTHRAGAVLGKSGSQSSGIDPG